MTTQELLLLNQVKSQLKQGNNLREIRLSLFKQLEDILPKVKLNKLVAVANLLYTNNIEPVLHWNVDALFEFCRQQSIQKVLMTTPADWLSTKSETDKFAAFEQVSRQVSKKTRLKIMKDMGCLDESIIDVLVSRRLELPQEVWSEIVGLIVTHTKVRMKKDTSFYSKGIKELLYKAYK